MILHINCSDPWFSLLENGIKPVEGRKAQKKYTSLKPGDEVCFHCTNYDRSFTAIIERVDKFKSLIEYLNAVSLEKALPGIKNLEEGIKIYLEWSTSEEISPGFSLQAFNKKLLFLTILTQKMRYDPILIVLI